MIRSNEGRLALVWLILMGLTAASVLAAYGGQSFEGRGWLALMALMLSAFVKTRLVLDHFLDLRLAQGGWRAFFSWAMFLLLALLTGLGLLAFFFEKAS